MLVIYHNRWIHEFKKIISFIIIHAFILIIIINHYHHEITTYLINTLSYNSNILKQTEYNELHEMHESLYISAEKSELNTNKRNLYDINSNNVTFDLVPSFEFNLDLNNTTDLYIWIQILTLIFCITPYLNYLVLHFFKNIILGEYVIQYLFLYWILSIIINYFIIVPILFNLVFHNYLEYLYFEFNLGIELSKYIEIYYTNLFITYAIINVLHFHLINKYMFYNFNIIRAFYLITIFLIFSNNYILYIFFSISTIILFELKNIYKITSILL